MRLLAIDPGPQESAWVLYDAHTGTPTTWAKEPNFELLRIPPMTAADAMAIECIASYGMAVGADVFQTCIVVGELMERWRARMSNAPIKEPIRVYRKDVKMHLCSSPRAKDSNIRQALIDRYGPGKEKAIGLKKSPGPLYGMSGDCWSALAVAITACETRLDGRQAA